MTDLTETPVTKCRAKYHPCKQFKASTSWRRLEKHATRWNDGVTKDIPVNSRVFIHTSVVDPGSGENFRALSYRIDEKLPEELDEDEVRGIDNTRHALQGLIVGVIKSFLAKIPAEEGAHCIRIGFQTHTDFISEDFSAQFLPCMEGLVSIFHASVKTYVHGGPNWDCFIELPSNREGLTETALVCASVRVCARVCVCVW